MSDYINLSAKLDELIVYRNILQDSAVGKLQQLLSNIQETSLKHQLIAELIDKAETVGLSGNVLHNYLIYRIAQDKNIFSAMIEKTGGTIGDSLFSAVVHDMAILQKLLQTDFNRLLAAQHISNYKPTLSSSSPSLTALQNQFVSAVNENCAPEKLAHILVEHYAVFGYGDIANYKAFRWHQDRLTGIEHYDPIRLENIIGYERQKDTLITNTEAFLAGKPANNALLIGARGTGKSSSVKALANHYFTKGLRLVEIAKHQMSSLPQIMELLRNRGKKFIIFLDDLSFEEFEVEYKYLKSVIEGGVEAKPDNVLIYATSNRRHLIKETWSDRSGDSDEIHRFDTVNEKISLSDRFGITITYLAPNQEEYLNIVEELAKQNGVDLPYDQLKQEAIRWELSHSGRSGRAAQQFIHYIMGK